MRKTILFASLILTICLVSVFSISQISAGRAPILTSFQLAKERSNIPKNSGTVIAIVGDQKIYESELERMLLGYEHRQNVLETQKTPLQSAPLTEKQQRTVALEQLIEKQRVRCFCQDNKLLVSNEEADQLRLESEKILAEQVASGNAQAIEYQKILNEQKVGSGLNEEEYNAMIREGYRDLLLGEKISELYQNTKSSLSFDEWWQQKSSYIKVEIK